LILIMMGMSGCVANFGEFAEPGESRSSPLFRGSGAAGVQRGNTSVEEYATIGYVRQVRIPSKVWQIFTDDLFRYTIELYLDSGPLFTVHFEDEREFRTGERVWIRYRGTKLEAIRSVE